MRRSELVAAAPCRADLFAAEGTGLTRSAVKKLSEAGNLLVNGVPAKAGALLRAGDRVEVLIPDPEPIEARAEDIPVEIVYEDGDLAVVNKPRGMAVHAGNGNREGTLVNALLFRLSSLSGINGAIRPGIVHRLDKDTTGLLVVAKNDAAHLSLAKQIAEKSARREYLALVEGVVGEGGSLRTCFGRDPKDRLKMAVLPEGKGRIAETAYSVEETFARNTLLRFSLRTGRTHQIRVHARYLGHPVVGDKLYGYKKQRFELAGQLLHACRLEFTHPRTGERMAFTAPLPEDFVRILDIVRRDV